MRKFFNKSELSLVNSESTNNKQVNGNKVDSPLSWIIALLGQVAHFTSVVIRNVLATSGWVRSAHTAPYAKSAHNSQLTKFAFTLAETLVVMGIIGVVAALTIPNLNQSTGDREKVTKLKKVYANLTDAFGRATAVYGPIDEWFINLPEGISENQRLADRMTEFMKISKSCGGDGSGCFPEDDYKTLDDDTCESPINWSDEPMYLLADGTAIDFYIYNENCRNSIGQLQNLCGFLYVDIDGVKGPNTLGKDYFLFNVAKSGVYPFGAQILEDNSANYGKSCFEGGVGCAGWIIEMGNMDYLKANKGVCPNGTTLSVDNPTCK